MYAFSLVVTLKHALISQPLQAKILDYDESFILPSTEFFLISLLFLGLPVKA